MRNVREQFAIFREQPNLAFLDSAASAQKPDAVLAAMTDFQETSYANIHRGVYDLSARATQAYEDARATVAQFIGAKNADTIVFTRNATAGINLVAQTWSKAHLRKGDAILLSRVEHHANLVPWQLLAAEKELEIWVIECDALGNITLEAIQEAWADNVKLLALTGMSNSLGTRPPVAEAITFAHSKGAKVLVDGSQSAVHSATDVTALDADFFVFTGHKLYGPTGIGVLYGKAEILAGMPPYEGGGDMIQEVHLPTGTTFACPPARFEAGTPNIVGAIGLAAAINWLQAQGNWGDFTAHEDMLGDMARSGLRELGVEIYGAADGPIISFNLPECHPHDVASILDQCGVAVRSGHHCCMPLMTHLGISGTIRASFGLYNTQADVEHLLAGLTKAKKMLKGI